MTGLMRLFWGIVEIFLAGVVLSVAILVYWYFFDSTAVFKKDAGGAFINKTTVADHPAAAAHLVVHRFSEKARGDCRLDPSAKHWLVPYIEGSEQPSIAIGVIRGRIIRDATGRKFTLTFPMPRPLPPADHFRHAVDLPMDCNPIYKPVYRVVSNPFRVGR